MFPLITKPPDTTAKSIEPNPKQQRPAAHVFEFLLNLVDEFDGGTRERSLAVSLGAGFEASAETADEVGEVGVERSRHHDFLRLPPGVAGVLSSKFAVPENDDADDPDAVRERSLGETSFSSIGE